MKDPFLLPRLVSKRLALYLLDLGALWPGKQVGTIAH